ncbi:MAG: nitronate monooxygenase [Candidatus Velthaea sp.]|jgi:nitronate monooxygenase
MTHFPTIIQGGMGAGVSSWRLAHAVSELGQLGVVSGTALDQILARRLQDGDAGGHMRRALDHFPVSAMAERVWQAYFIPGGKADTDPYKSVPMPVRDSPRELLELTVVANFVEVWLAREGHANPVGINYLEKIQVPHLPSLYGALLAGVGYVIVGAGIPLKIPEALDRLARHEPATYPLNVIGAQEGDETALTFDPSQFIGADPPPLVRPRFLAIVASNVLAASLVKKIKSGLDGFVIEGPTAGGHNAPPRGKMQVDAGGVVVYGERDRVDLEKIRELGLPFWLAGGYGSAEKLREALAQGAAGIQVGTAFAFCAESGLRPDYKRAIIEQVVNGDARVFTDPVASPTNFPFKVARLEGTVSEEGTYLARPRICDLGFLRDAYRTDDGAIGYRCSAEPVNLYVKKGGKPAETVGRKCICNALLATIGQPQRRKGKIEEKGIVTSGDDLVEIGRFVRPDRLEYRAADVLAILLGEALPQPHASGTAAAT